jgi:hypothetical protein
MYLSIIALQTVGLDYIVTVEVSHVLGVGYHLFLSLHKIKICSISLMLYAHAKVVKKITACFVP